MHVAATWEPDSDHVRLARWQVRVLARWADEDADAPDSSEEVATRA